MTESEVSEYAIQPLSFGPRQLVTSASPILPGSAPGCATCDDTGVIHAFWSYLEHKPEVGIPNVAQLIYLSGPPGSMSAYPAGDNGVPLAVAADGETVYLLYRNDAGVWLAEASADGSLGELLLLSRNGAGQGALVADQGGWWAVWIEDANSKLFEAYGGWGNGEFPRTPVASELTDIQTYDSASLALGPWNPADPADRWIYLSWGMTRRNNTTVVRLATRKVQAAGWAEQPWLPTAAMHSDIVGSPALAFDGALQAAYVRAPSVGYMSNPSQSATPQPLSTTSFGAPKLAVSNGQTVIAWVDDNNDLWAVRPGSRAVKLARQAPDVGIIGLTSYLGNAVLLTYEDENSVYVRTQTG